MPQPPASPRVAIVTRTRDRPLLLPRCLESVLRQDFRDWVQVIVNDGGDAPALEAQLEPYRERYGGRLRVVHHASSQGMQNASNAGIAATESECLAIHDDDDSWEPGFLRACLERLDRHALAHPDRPVGGVVSQINWIVEEIRDSAVVEVWRGDYLPTERVSVLDAFRRNPTAPIAFLYRRDAHARLGLYDQAYDVLGDWVFLLSLVRDCEILTVPEKLANYHWRKADAATPAGYGNTVTEQLAHHLDLRQRFVDERMREALRAVPALEGPLLALAQPILETAEATRGLDERFARLGAKLDRQPDREELQALREQLVEVRQVQLETLGHLGRVLEELARTKERDYWIQKALDHHSVQLDWTRGTLDRHSGEIHETRTHARDIAKRLRRWEFVLTRNPEHHVTRQEIAELNKLSFEDRARESDAPALAAAHHWLDSAEVLSLDVFDTAVFRTCGDPHAVFELLAFRISDFGVECPDFAGLRVDAEDVVRRRNEEQGLGDLTLAEIYAELGQRLALPEETTAALLELELATERRLCFANPSVLALARSAHAAGKTIVYISDMYVPEDFVRTVLRDAGFPEGRLFVSSTHRITKHTGALFDHVLRETGVPAERFLHLGDNRHSDFEMAHRAGLRAVHWQGLAGGTPFAEQLVPLPQWRQRDLVSRLSLGLARARRARAKPADTPAGFWETVGYEIAGPVYFSFLGWCLRQARTDGVSRLLFLSRDGYYLTRAFERIRARHGITDLEGTYLFASRRLYNLACHGFLNDKVLEFLLSPNPYLRVRDFVERIGWDAERYRGRLAEHGFKQLDKVLTQPGGGFRRGADRDRLARFFQSIAPDVEALAREERDRLMRYFRAQGVFEPDTAVVDIGWGATSLLAIQELVAREKPGHRQLGYYFGTWEFAQPVVDAGCRLKSYFMDREKPESSAEVLTSAVEALEFIFTAPHGSVECLREVDGAWQPIEAEIENPPPVLENLRAMHEAGLSFVDDMLEFGIPADSFDPVENGYLHAAFKRFFKNPTPSEAALYGQLQTRDSFGSRSRLRSLAAIPAARFFKARAIERGFAASYWKNGFAALVRGLDH